MRKATRNLLSALVFGFAAVSMSAQTPRPADSLVPANSAINLVERLNTANEIGNRIIGKVIDRERSNVGNVQLRLRNLQNGHVVRETESNVDGEFAFTVDPGTYVVELILGGSVAALSDVATLGGGELVQTLVLVPGHWDATQREIVPDRSLARFLGVGAAQTMASATMTNAGNQGIAAVDPGEPVSGQ